MKLLSLLLFVPALALALSGEGGKYPLIHSTISYPDIVAGPCQTSDDCDDCVGDYDLACLCKNLLRQQYVRLLANRLCVCL
jgi:hypothetical protein